MNIDKNIILATSSPYRQEAFGFLGIDFKAEGSKVDESLIKRANPRQLVRRLSKLKAESVAENNPNTIIIGMDSVGYFNGQILEKPKSKKEALKRLKSLSGRKFYFLTGVFIINTASGKTISRVIETSAFMRNLSDKEVKKYLDEDPLYNTYCLGFDPLGHSSSSFIKKIKGGYNNITRGIPLEIMPGLLKLISK